ncbi:MAG: alpha/beta hydrolase [Sphingomicrobium sp.]
MTNGQPDICYLETEDNRRLAYRLRPGLAPTLLFLPGYASDMDGAKAVALDAFAGRRGLAMLRFDYSGTGSSSGAFEDGTLAGWLDETLMMIDQLTAGPVILIGSSMGAWIALHVAQRLPNRVQALVGIAAAPDFTDWGVQREGGGLSPAFRESGQRLLLLKSEIAIDCPVRLVHGDADQDVPIAVAVMLMERLRSADVQLDIVKAGGHRLSVPHEIEAILRTVAALLEPAP